MVTKPVYQAFNELDEDPAPTWQTYGGNPLLRSTAFSMSLEALDSIKIGLWRRGTN